MSGKDGKAGRTDGDGLDMCCERESERERERARG